MSASDEIFKANMWRRRRGLPRREAPLQVVHYRCAWEDCTEVAFPMSGYCSRYHEELSDFVLALC